MHANISSKIPILSLILLIDRYNKKYIITFFELAFIGCTERKGSSSTPNSLKPIVYIMHKTSIKSLI